MLSFSINKNNQCLVMDWARIVLVELARRTTQQLYEYASTFSFQWSIQNQVLPLKSVQYYIGL